MNAALADALALLLPASPFLGAVALLVAIVVVAESHVRRRRVRARVAPLAPTEVDWDWQGAGAEQVRRLDEVLRELDIADRGGAS